MKIGLISDSHDNIINIEKSVAIFKKNNIKTIIHAGDFVAPFSVKKMFCIDGIKTIGVFGNNDGEKKGILKTIENHESEIHEPPHSFVMETIKICIVHDLNDLSAGDQNKYDLVIFGHSHKKEIIKNSKTLLINPGECGGWLSNKPSIAVLNTDSMACTFLDVI